HVGPDCTCVKSSTRTPSSALPALPKGLLDGRRSPLAADFLAADFFAAFTAGLRTAFAFRFALPCFFCFLLLAIGRLLNLSSSNQARLFLFQRALRIEVADAAALA